MPGVKIALCLVTLVASLLTPNYAFSPLNNSPWQDVSRGEQNKKSLDNSGHHKNFDQLNYQIQPSSEARQNGETYSYEEIELEVLPAGSKSAAKGNTKGKGWWYNLGREILRQEARKEGFSASYNKKTDKVLLNFMGNGKTDKMSGSKFDNDI